MKSLILILFFWLMGQTILAQETLKILKSKGQPIIIAQLNGKKAYFLVDTGSDVSLLNLKDAARFKFKYVRTNSKGYKISGLNSQHQGEMLTAYNANLYLNSRKIIGSYRVFDLTNIVNSLSISSGITINGIIGSDLMRRYRFLIDYEAGEIRF